MAHPGRIVPLDLAPADPPGPVPAIWALCLTLLDRETPVWLDAAARRAEMAEALRLYRGTPLVADTRSGPLVRQVWRAGDRII